MKRIISLALCTFALVTLFSACNNDPKPDAEVGLKSFALQKAINSSLTEDCTATIADGSMLLTVPKSAGTTTFIPTFTATANDKVFAGSTELVSGTTSVNFTDGMTISVKDEVSNLSANYTLKLLVNDGKAELLSVAFAKADNPELDKDYAADEIADETIVRIPGGGAGKTLVMSVTVGEGDVVKVAGKEITNGKAEVDASFPIDITVADIAAGISKNYVVKVGKVLEYIVSYLGTHTEGSMSTYDMQVNPKTGEPYFVYLRKLEGESNNGISVAKWSADAFSLVGKSGIADASSRSASLPAIGFAVDGTAYIKYFGAEVASKPSVWKFGGDWELVGTNGFTPVNVNTSYYNPIFVHPEASQPAFLFTGNTKSTDTYRTISSASFNGSEWASSVVPGFPKYGEGPSSSSGMFYTSRYVASGKKAYMLLSFNQWGYYLAEVGSKGELTSLINDFKPGASTAGLPANLDIDVDSEGNVFIFAADWASSRMQIFKYSDSSIINYGDGIAVTIGTSGSVTEDAAFAVNPIDNTIIAVVDDKDGNPVFSILNDSLQWDKIAPAEAPTAANGEYRAAFASDGTGYVSYKSKNGIELYYVGLEPDVLPE